MHILAFPCVSSSFFVIFFCISRTIVGVLQPKSKKCILWSEICQKQNRYTDHPQTVHLDKLSHLITSVILIILNPAVDGNLALRPVTRLIAERSAFFLLQRQCLSRRRVPGCSRESGWPLCRKAAMKAVVSADQQLLAKTAASQPLV